MPPYLKASENRAIFFFSEKMWLFNDKSKFHFNGANKELKFCFTMSRNLFRQSKDFWHPLRRKMLYFLNNT